MWTGQCKNAWIKSWLFLLNWKSPPPPHYFPCEQFCGIFRHVLTHCAVRKQDSRCLVAGSIFRPTRFCLVMNYDDIHICYQIVLVVCFSLCILLLGKESPWNEEIHISWGKRSTQRVKPIKMILDSLQKTGFLDILTKNRGLWFSPS